MNEKTELGIDGELTSWRNAQDQLTNVTVNLNSMKEELKSRQAEVRSGVRTSGDVMDDFLFAGLSPDQLFLFATLRATCQELARGIQGHGGELVLKIAGSKGRRGESVYGYDFGLLPESPEIEPKLDEESFRSAYADVISIPTTAVTTIRSHDRKIVFGGPIDIIRSELPRLDFNDASEPVSKDKDKAFTLVLIGNEAVMGYYAARDNLKEFYENCHRIGQKPELPQGIADRLQLSAQLVGARIISRLVQSRSGDIQLPESDLDYVLASGRTVIEVINLAASVAIDRLKDETNSPQ